MPRTHAYMHTAVRGNVTQTQKIQPEKIINKSIGSKFWIAQGGYWGFGTLFQPAAIQSTIEMEQMFFFQAEILT